MDIGCQADLHQPHTSLPITLQNESSEGCPVAKESSTVIRRAQSAKPSYSV